MEKYEAKHNHSVDEDEIYDRETREAVSVHAAVRRLNELTTERDALLESMKWVAMHTKLLRGVGRSIEKEDVWIIKEHAERAIKQVQP